MNMFWKKKKITFTNNIKGVAEVMPIIPARNIKRKWINNALIDFQKIRQQPEYGMHPMIHTVRCPGIFKLMRHGWVMRTWQDITIQTYGDLESFQWECPVAQSDLNGVEYVSGHPSFQLADFFDEWHSNTLRNVIKINSGWSCIVPKGYYLLEMPVSYNDDVRFTTLTGVFYREQGPAQMNPQFLWHILNGKELIKAGTPIAQYVLVEKDEWDYEVNSSQTTTEHDIFYINSSNRFVKNYKAIKDYYSHPSSSK